MHLRPDYAFDEEVTALMVASDQITTNEYVLDQMLTSWILLEQRGELEDFLTARRAVMTYTGAAYAIQDATAFKRGVRCLVEFSMERSQRIPVPPAGLLPDLAIAIAVGQSELAQGCSTKILAQADKVEPYSDPWGLAALILARLLERDYAGAQASAWVLSEVCEEKAFDRVTCEVFGAFAEAASGIALDQEPVLRDALVELDRLRFTYINREITRYRQGKPNAVDPVDCWDFLSSALLRIAERVYEDLKGERVPVRRFCDLDWVAEAMRDTD